MGMSENTVAYRRNWQKARAMVAQILTSLQARSDGDDDNAFGVLSSSSSSSTLPPLDRKDDAVFEVAQPSEGVADIVKEELTDIV